MNKCSRHDSLTWNWKLINAHTQQRGYDWRWSNITRGRL